MKKSTIILLALAMFSGANAFAATNTKFAAQSINLQDPELLKGPGKTSCPNASTGLISKKTAYVEQTTTKKAVKAVR